MKQPAKPEMNNKYNMIRCYHNTPADRYKKAQPLMVPFDAEEESPADKLYTLNPQPMTKSQIVVLHRQKTSTRQPPVAEG